VPPRPCEFLRRSGRRMWLRRGQRQRECVAAAGACGSTFRVVGTRLQRMPLWAIRHGAAGQVSQHSLPHAHGSQPSLAEGSAVSGVGQLVVSEPLQQPQQNVELVADGCAQVVAAVAGEPSLHQLIKLVHVAAQRRRCCSCCCGSAHIRHTTYASFMKHFITCNVWPCSHTHPCSACARGEADDEDSLSPYGPSDKHRRDFFGTKITSIFWRVLAHTRCTLQGCRTAAVACSRSFGM
jgi:hypothetical protein